MSKLDRADVTFQQDLIRSMAVALAHGLVEPDTKERERWATRADAIATVACNTYGEPGTLALMDQAREESVKLALKMSR